MASAQRILIINPFLEYSYGQGKANQFLIEALLKEGFHVTALSTDKWASPFHPHLKKICLFSFIKSHTLRTLLLMTSNFFSVGFFKLKGYKILTNTFVPFFKVDFLYLHSLHANGFYRCVEKSILSRAKHVLCVNHELKNEIEAYVRPGTKIETFINGVDTKLFVPQAMKTEANTLLFAGEAKSKIKNFQLLVNFLDAHKEYTLDLYSGPVDPTQDEKFKQLVEEKRIRLKGFAKDIHRIIGNYFCSFVPSHYDACPMVLFESMSCGLPVISSKFCGNAYVIKNGINGFILADNNDPEEVFQILKKLKDKKYYSDVSKAGRETMMGYDKTKQASKISEYIRTAINNPN